MTENKNHEIQETNAHENHEHDHDSLNLKGTFLLVMSLGGVMVVSWVLAFLLFMSRM